MREVRWGAWTGLLGSAMAALAIVAIPVFLIRPFSAQTPGMLDAAYAMRRWSPGVTAAALLLVLVFAGQLWRRSRGALRKAGLAIPVLLTGASAWMARQNHFEWMFAPLPNAGFVRAHAADFVKPTDMVLAVALKGEAVAYPVNQLAYHHVVEDAIGGVPIVATY